MGFLSQETPCKSLILEEQAKCKIKHTENTDNDKTDNGEPLKLAIQGFGFILSVEGFARSGDSADTVRVGLLHQNNDDYEKRAKNDKCNANNAEHHIYGIAYTTE